MTPPSSGPTLITGCSSGIGRAIALRLAREGGAVYASARRLDAIEDLADHGCTPLALDVTDPSARAEAIARIEADHGAVAALVNNAGFGQQGPLEQTPLEAIRVQFETNVFGAIALCQAVLPGMRRTGAGRIVNLSSMGGRLSFPGGAAYHGSKYALEAISDVLRFEVAGFGIKVVLVEPGPVASDFGRASIDSLDRLSTPKDDAYRDFRAGIRSALEGTFDDPGITVSSPDDVAEAVWRALSEPDPEPRIVVGAMAEELIALRAASSDREWDRVLAGMYPRPGEASAGSPDSPRNDGRVNENGDENRDENRNKNSNKKER